MVLVFCSCCDKHVSKSTEYRHRKLRAQPHVRATHAYHRSVLHEPEGVDAQRRVEIMQNLAWFRKDAFARCVTMFLTSVCTIDIVPSRRRTQDDAPTHNVQPQASLHAPFALHNTASPRRTQSPENMNVEDRVDDAQVPASHTDISGSTGAAQHHIRAIQLDIWGPADRLAWRRVDIEDIDEDEDSTMPEEPEEESNVYDDTWWNEYVDEILESELDKEGLEGPGLSAVEQLGEEFERSYNAICERDCL